MDNQQCRYVCGRCDGEHAFEITNAEYDLVEPIERFDSFVHELCDYFEFTLDKYERRNVSDRAISRDQLDKGTLERIMERNAEDYLLYERVSKRVPGPDRHGLP